MKLGGALCVVLVATSSFGCKLLEKKVPDDIVKKALNQSLRHLAGTGAAMCGAPTKGLINADVTIKSRGEKSTGIAHVKGAPWPTAGEDLPAKCEGDIEFAFSYTTKTHGTGKRRKTETTWFLDKIKLVDVQTKGVKFKGEKEESNSPDDDDDDDGDKPTEKASKKKATDDE